MKILHSYAAITMAAMLSGCNGGQSQTANRTPVDYVNSYIGDVSHLLVPAFPIIQLPNSMLRVCPERTDYTTELLNRLPLIVTNHQERSAFNLSPYQGRELRPIVTYNYDSEHLTPCSYEVDLNDNNMKAECALSYQSALYRITFEADRPAYIIVNSRNGPIHIGGNFIGRHQQLSASTSVYVYIEPQEKPISADILKDGVVEASKDSAGSINTYAAWRFADGTATVSLRYGISFIGEEQTEKNMRNELKDYNIKDLTKTGRQIWNEVLEHIKVEGGTEDDKTVLYSSFYRVFERPICMGETGDRYFSASDGEVRDDDGTPFYNSDWAQDAYHAAHPLRTLIDRKEEEDIIASFLLMAEQMGTMWMPTLSEVTDDSYRINSNHAVAAIADALAKRLNINAAKTYKACRKGIEEKTLVPWSGAAAGWLGDFYRENGYIPALRPDGKETDPNMCPFEKHQPVTAALGTSYDQWCLSHIAEILGKKDEAAHYLQCSYNYRNLFSKETSFFHPKDKEGDWIAPFDYRYAGGMGVCEYYGENNGRVYRWDVSHDVADLINLMGGEEQLIASLDRIFSEPLGRGKCEFYAQLPDHTGNVGQFSMADEPPLHVPYLYNYAGQPWKTQKRIRQVLKTWFRSDLMGMPGDEDGRGIASFVVFSSLGFCPVAPGAPVYNIGSPLFTHAEITLSNDSIFEIRAPNVSEEGKYIQSATLNG